MTSITENGKLFVPDFINLWRILLGINFTHHEKIIFKLFKIIHKVFPLPNARFQNLYRLNVLQGEFLL